MDIFGKEEGYYPDRAKRWFKTTISYTNISAGQVAILVPSHTLIHGVKAKPSIQWNQADITVNALNGSDSLLGTYAIGNVTPSATEYKISTTLSAVPHTGSTNVIFNFGGTVGSLTQGELEVWLQLSRTL